MSVDTTPATWTPGEIVSAAKMNTEVRDFAAGLQGVWEVFTPTWTAATTNPALGNGTLTGRMLRVGKTIICNITLVAGSTTTYGSGAWIFALPVPSVWATLTNIAMGGAVAFDTSATARRTGQVFNNAPGTVQVLLDTGAVVAAAAPWTWATGDSLSLDLVYEAN